MVCRKASSKHLPWGAVGVGLTDMSLEYLAFVLEGASPLLLVVLIVKVYGLPEQVLSQVSVLIQKATATLEVKTQRSQE